MTVGQGLVKRLKLENIDYLGNIGVRISGVAFNFMLMVCDNHS